MAATDQNYRNQYALDIVFAVSSILMLVSVLWMFVQDYNREFKHEQRSFRDIETALAQRAALEQIPSAAAFEKAEKEITRARDERDKNADKIDALRRDADKLQPEKEKLDARYQDIKASLDSVKSFYDIEVDEHGLTKKAEGYQKEAEELQRKLAEAQSAKDDKDQEIKYKRNQADKLEKPLVDALAAMKKVTDQFDTQVNTAINKRWGIGDAIRNLPIIDGFAAPIKIHQYTIDTIPIDYNFKYATRFDRCTTCHEGIDRPAYTKTALTALTAISEEQTKSLEEARDIMAKRRKAVEDLPEAARMPPPDDLQLNEISKDELTASRISEFAAHPRLGLFVATDSKHPAERFGCSACHSGQGSATSFTLASHTPNDFHTEERWKKAHDWSSNHYWDFPMLPMRFIESSCVKCHHEVTDLISTNNRKEAPKLLRGYTLLREFGCFGCHEINGRKKGQEIGPDIRLENYPPVEDLPPGERVKIEADPDTRPGNMRKVGPSLLRLSEKVNPEWTVKWLRAPREFRPDTKMPHFYGLSNNDAKYLPDEQKKFPDTEIQAISHYLFKASESYMDEVKALRKDNSEVQQKDAARVQELLDKTKLSDDEKKELADVQTKIRRRKVEPLVDLAPGGYTGDAAQGRLLFTERGCLACHSHDGTTTAHGNSGDKAFAPAVTSEAQFGPNLSQVAAKLGGKDNDKAQARKWLVQWLLDPHVHSPRSRMPVTHLETKQAADIAAWLLSQRPQDFGPGWDGLKIAQPTKQDLQKLAKVYLIRLMSKSNLDKLDENKLPDYVPASLPAEEQKLVTKEYTDEDGLKMYLGKKAIGRLGCYACHDIPGFENARPIGTELNDWGKKDPTKIAFEDINSYVKEHYRIVDQMTDEKGKAVLAEVENGVKKMPYERFFSDLLIHKQREGFLHQKLTEPRSYDHNRIRAWDDRLRMPQFRFARSRKRGGESEQEYEARANLEEAEAREAVMTFVLGLVAEPIPVQSVNHPSGDRLAEVKGRQVLEKFNCAGCHLIQPGLFEFKATAAVSKRLDDMYQGGVFRDPADHFFPNHYNWAGAAPTADDRLTAFAVRSELNQDDPSNPYLQFRLAHALRFKAPDGTWKNIRAAYDLPVPPKDMIYPPADVVSDKDKLAAFLRDQGPYGGAFTDLLVNFLADKDKKTYERDRGDSPKARIAAPPILIGQGERTQGNWLYQFLLDPQPIRRMTVLRMPRFNMSKEEARALVAYFAGVERRLNTGVELKFPFEAPPQQEDLAGAYWKSKTQEYVRRLENKETKDGQGAKKSLYQMRVEELTPLWKQLERDFPEERAYKDAKKVLDQAEAALKSEKDETKKKQLTEDVEEAKKRLDALVAASSVDNQKRAWREREAYVTDGFRLLANTQLCLGCHQVGNLQPIQKQQEGPPLDLSAARLRSAWTKRWLTYPQRFLTYSSIMPTNFPENAPGQYQQWFAGAPLEQITAVRDVLMIYPRAAAMPVNRFWEDEQRGTGGKK
jgi:mono/diheme cytochrome c family protein